MNKTLVGILMGSRSDWEAMKAAAEMLKKFGVAHECRILSAHRAPDAVSRYAASALCVLGAYLQANVTTLDFRGALTTIGLLVLAGILAHEVALSFLGAATLIGGIWALLSGGAVLPAAAAVVLGVAMFFGMKPSWSVPHERAEGHPTAPGGTEP